MARKLNLATFAIFAAALLHISMAQQTHVVGDALAWSVPNGGAAAYTTWASRKTFAVGDILVFNFTTGLHSVAEVSKANFDSCNTANPISISTNGPTNITLRSAGSHYYLCTLPSHCTLGQKLAINVSGSASPAPQPAAARPVIPPTVAPVTAPSVSPSTAPAPSVTATPALAPAPSVAAQTFIVGGNMGWNVPTTGGPNAYQTWANGKSFKVGDTLVFNFVNGRHNVAMVNKAAYDSCNTTSPINTISTGPARITLTNSGENYYMCTFPSHCSLGQKLAINVTSTSAAAPTPSIAATPSGSTVPSVPSGDSPVTSPPPPSASAPSLVLAALPVTFLSLAFARLLN
ncbi:PREDICTED: blue copper protein-like [Nicotiana attenuata]|uniref:Blue copper protein n=1 Tax=Nicotiana attenuata TaxID=49451 RepID=A0A1J6L5S9_NICAT|nr:PREDICTED: blue copper protein-like [Nicotiana attenuata]OIT26497.1 blue copper protein [Nicotiana attenuata]